MLVIRSSGTESQEQEAGVTQERCGINFTDPLLSCRRGEERRGGGNPLSQKVVEVKNRPLLTLI